MIKSSSNSSKNSSSTERKLAKKALRRAPNPVRVFSSYDRIFSWMVFFAEAQPRLELPPLPLQQSFPQRLMKLLLPKSDSASATSEVSSTWAIVSDTSGSKPHPELLLVLEPPLLSCSFYWLSFRWWRGHRWLFHFWTISPICFPSPSLSNFRFHFHFFKRAQSP